MKRVIVTTSWDDGHKLDARLCRLLKKYDLPATFYIAPHNREFPAGDLLADNQVADLSEDFEIGSHTMTHPVLPTISLSEVAAELRESKEFLSEITGHEITTFCYPRGAYTPAIAREVKKAGYRYARTVERFSFGGGDRFEMGTALEAHRNPLPTLPRDMLHIARLMHYNPIATLRCLNWEYLAKRLFDKVLEEGGTFHLWGHSWVVDGARDWDKLERVFAYISGREDVTYLTNGELPEAQA
jgi:peptidoglycan/xylan/chitin deacetylase (PgdA/CDA1 family)